MVIMQKLELKLFFYIVWIDKMFFKQNRMQNETEQKGYKLRASYAYYSLKNKVNDFKFGLRIINEYLLC